MNLDKLEFDTVEPRRRDVTLTGEAFALLEADAAAVAQYDNRKMSSSSMAADGTVKLGPLADLRAYAVSLCLRRGDERVSEDTVRSWRDVVVDALYNAVVEMSPTLVGTPTLESLVQQRDKLNERIARLEARKDDPKG